MNRSPFRPQRAIGNALVLGVVVVVVSNVAS
jgi:hypothetical protein